ncbi:hypothetical protein DAQ1742_03894 [Dickeya aquatica]|uniref:Uncharacterized protein n=1 Tax=Dickeya aquatica TaxID=1401087 RepID=A0A375AFN1_9GAMM|nr:hypothetical protein DAQ1742_03894 [Dickeya aquatica]
MNWWQELSPEPDNNTHHYLRKRPGKRPRLSTINLSLINQ